MKKKVLLIVFCVTFGLTGCGTESATESGPQETITFDETVTTNEGTEIKPEQGKPEETAPNTEASDVSGDNKKISDADIITGNPEVGMVTAYDEIGSEVILTENTDGTYLTGDGITYYLGEDGVYRSKGKADIYADKPQTSKKGPSGAITQDQALKAIRKYCFSNDPGLEETMNSGDNGAYFDVSTSDSGEIVVLYRSYTAAQIRYYINTSTGDVYVTELVPGIINEEQRTDESFNIGKYLDSF